MAAYTTAVSTFNGLKTSYETALTAYETAQAAIKAGSKTVTTLPAYPLRPVAPKAYDGLRIYPVSNNPVTKEIYHFYLDGGHGGWGGLTMGLLKPYALAEKSFGMFYYGKGTDYGKKGYVVAPGDMLDTNLNPKYMIVSLFSNTWGTSSDIAGLGAGRFEILFASSEWNTAALAAWTPPATPTAASASPSSNGANVLRTASAAIVGCASAYFVY